LSLLIIPLPTRIFSFGRLMFKVARPIGNLYSSEGRI